MFRRFAVGDRGMEMIEWAIVGVAFAAAAAAVWTPLATTVSDSIGLIASAV